MTGQPIEDGLVSMAPQYLNQLAWTEEGFAMVALFVNSAVLNTLWLAVA